MFNLFRKSQLIGTLAANSLKLTNVTSVARFSEFSDDNPKRMEKSKFQQRLLGLRLECAN